MPAAVVRDVLTMARLAPSGGNLQPWRVHVLAGEPLERFLAVIEATARDESGERSAEYAVYPPNLWEPYRTRRYRCGESLYAALAIPREDKVARRRQLARNLRFFGAPVGLFFSLDRRFDSGQWADLGMFMQTLMLVARGHGLETCAQESWATFHATIARFLEFPPEQQLFCGMALGYADQAAPINGCATARAPLEDFVTFLGI